MSDVTVKKKVVFLLLSKVTDRMKGQDFLKLVLKRLSMTLDHKKKKL